MPLSKGQMSRNYEYEHLEIYTAERLKDKDWYTVAPKSGMKTIHTDDKNSRDEYLFHYDHQGVSGFESLASRRQAQVVDYPTLGSLRPIAKRTIGTHYVPMDDAVLRRGDFGVDGMQAHLLASADGDEIGRRQETNQRGYDRYIGRLHESDRPVPEAEASTSHGKGKGKGKGKEQEKDKAKDKDQFRRR